MRVLYAVQRGVMLPKPHDSSHLLWPWSRGVQHAIHRAEGHVVRLWRARAHRRPCPRCAASTGRYLRLGVCAAAHQSPLGAAYRTLLQTPPVRQRRSSSGGVARAMSAAYDTYARRTRVMLHAGMIVVHSLRGHGSTSQSPLPPARSPDARHSLGRKPPQREANRRRAPAPAPARTLASHEMVLRDERPDEHERVRGIRSAEDDESVGRLARGEGQSSSGGSGGGGGGGARRGTEVSVHAQRPRGRARGHDGKMRGDGRGAAMVDGLLCRSSHLEGHTSSVDAASLLAPCQGRVARSDPWGGTFA